MIAPRGLVGLTGALMKAFYHPAPGEGAGVGGVSGARCALYYTRRTMGAAIAHAATIRRLAGSPGKFVANRNVHGLHTGRGRGSSGE